MTFRKIGALTCALVAMSGLAACGSDESDSSSSGTTSQNTVASSNAPKGDPIKLGFICSCSGPQKAVIAKAQDVARVWANHVNDTGGINGSPVELIIKDDGADPARALQAAKTLVEDDKVIAIVGEISLADAAFADYVTSKGIPIVGGGSPEPVFGESPNFYASGATLLALVTGTLAQAEGNEKLGAMYCAESPVCAQLIPLAEGIAKLFDLEVIPAKVSGTAPNHTAPCLSMKSKGADALYVASNGPVVQSVVADCHQQGYKPVNVAQTSTTTNVMLKDPNLENSKVASSNANPYDDSLPAVKEFQDALEKYSPGLLTSDQFAYDAFYPWLGGKLFEAAAEAGNVDAKSTPKDVKKGLYALKDETLGGLSAPLTFTQGKPFFSPCWFTMTIAGSTLKSENANKPTCLPPGQATALMKAAAG